MSEEEIKASIHGFYSALIAKDVDKSLSFFSENAVLVWGPFTFEGKLEIKKWATELGELFQTLLFEEKNLTVQGDEAINNFYMMFLLPNGQKGLIPGMGVYELKNEKIQYIKIALSYGYLTL